MLSVENKEEWSMIANTPPMGWNSWDCYGAAVTEDTVRKNAEYMARYLKPYGWEYVVVDIQWARPNAVDHSYESFSELAMDEYGRLTPALNRFPSAKGGAGFRHLADYVHSLGLKFGIHIMRGMPRMAAHRKLPIEGSGFFCNTAANPHSICMWNPDMYGVNPRHPGARDWYRSQAELWASWGVDYVKVDDLAAPHYHEEECELIRDALDATGRPIALSLSPGDSELPRARHYAQHAQAWRISNDFWDTWRQLEAQYELCAAWAPFAKDGHWPDADMLPLGHIALRSSEYEVTERRCRFTPAEQKSMMSLWCLVRSPLMLGGELRDNTPDDLALITRADVLQVSRSARDPRRVVKDGADQIWAAECEDGGAYLLLLNTAGYDRKMTFTLDETGLSGHTLKNLWTGEMSEIGSGIHSVEIEAHGACLFHLL